MILKNLQKNKLEATKGMENNSLTAENICKFTKDLL